MAGADMGEVRPHRHAPSSFKTGRIHAEPNPMNQGGTPFRRGLATLATGIALGATLVTGNPRANSADAPAIDPPPAPGGARIGSGPYPVDLSSTASPRRASFGGAISTARMRGPSRRSTSSARPTTGCATPRPDGSVPFRPDMIQTRKYLARAAVKAFAPGAAVDPAITFTDLDPSQAFYKWANIAVQRGG